MKKLLENIEDCKQTLLKEYNKIKNSIDSYDYPVKLQNLKYIQFYLDYFLDILTIDNNYFQTNYDAIKLDICYDSELKISESVLSELIQRDKPAEQCIKYNLIEGYYLNIEYKYFGESRIIFPNYSSNFILFHFYTENSKYDSVFYDYTIEKFPNMEISRDLFNDNTNKIILKYSNLKYSNLLNNYIGKYKSTLSKYYNFDYKLTTIELNALIEKYMKNFV